ncbi:hypothetical protein L227DRAFT_615717 [Lentinus tigrinus ALCF2SS1-6]|uniref:Uncharacterized protein n=1 Tax=Lentinus tigrinus ALCF2SS1-6 TaxID=1328759 RepID=A0A5C2RTL2_9APHY|nr:hypothetical protein L227DRAFT_615717 [Lentinus tigrinus ALCF2SS1-6]
MAPRPRYPEPFKHACQQAAERRRPFDRATLRIQTCPSCQIVGGLFDRVVYYKGAASKWLRRCRHCRRCFFPDQEGPNLMSTQRLERMRAQLESGLSPPESQLLSSSADPSPAHYNLWSPSGGVSSSHATPATSQQTPESLALDEEFARRVQAELLSPSTDSSPLKLRMASRAGASSLYLTAASCQQTANNLAADEAYARCLQAELDGEGAKIKQEKAQLGSLKTPTKAQRKKPKVKGKKGRGKSSPNLEASPILDEPTSSENRRTRYSTLTRAFMDMVDSSPETPFDGSVKKKRKRGLTENASGDPQKTKIPAPFPMDLSPVLAHAPLIEVPPFPEPIIALPDNLFAGGSSMVPPPSQPRTAVPGQMISPLSVQNVVAAGEEETVATPATQDDVIVISSDDDDDTPASKRFRQGSVISLTDSEDDLVSGTSNKENVPVKEERTSPPPYVLIEYPPKDIIELPVVHAPASALSITNKFRAIISGTTPSTTAALQPPRLDPQAADLAAKALFAKLVENVPTPILQETVEKMNAELLHRGKDVQAVKQEDPHVDEDAAIKEEPQADRDDDSDAEGNESDSSSESSEADVLISNATPFADIYSNETERIPRAQHGVAVSSLTIRARWELRVTIWYRHDLPPCIKSVEFDVASGEFRFAEKWVTRRVFEGNKLTRVEVFNRETARWNLHDIHEPIVVSMFDNHTLLVRLPLAGKLVGFASQIMLAAGTCLTVDHTRSIANCVKGKARAAA